MKNLRLEQLNSRELQEIQGGGPIADIVEELVAFWNCGCKPPKHAGQTWNEYNGKF